MPRHGVLWIMIYGCMVGFSIALVGPAVALPRGHAGNVMLDPADVVYIHSGVSTNDKRFNLQYIHWVHFHADHYSIIACH